MTRKSRTSKKPSRRVVDELDPGFTSRSDRGRKARADGNAFERKVAQKLRVLYPDAKRSFGQAREGNEVPDIVGTPFWIEAGAGHTITIHSKLGQGLGDSASSPSKEHAGKPVLAITHHPKSSLTIVSMTLEQFIALLSDHDA